MLATSYLSRRWPAKYFRLCKSLRPCSGWERVVSLRFVTNKLSFAVYRLFSAFSVYTESHIRYKLRNLKITFVEILLHTSQSLTSFCFAKFPFVLLRASSSFGLRPHSTQISIRKSPRPISNARLKMLPLLHLHPINVVIYNGTY